MGELSLISILLFSFSLYSYPGILCNDWCGTPTVPMFSTEEKTGGGRIVGGSIARPGSHPWIVSLDDGNGHNCGGALIRVSEKEETDIVVTAAHCVYDYDKQQPSKPAQKNVRAGLHHLSDKLSQDDRRVVRVNRSIWHELYPRNDIVDIAVLVLEDPIQFNDKVQPICLHSSTDRKLSDGAEVIVAGWGATKENNTILPNMLMQVSLPMVTGEQCRQLLSNEVELDLMFCAGGGTKDTCNGDSGGPAVERLEDGVYVMQGLVAFGRVGCARAGQPTAYTRVAYYVGWIYQQVKTYSKVYQMNPDKGDLGFWLGVIELDDTEDSSTSTSSSEENTGGWIASIISNLASGLAGRVYRKRV